MSIVIHLQILNKILHTGSFDIVTNNGLSEKNFPEYEEEFNYIKTHYDIYKKVPDKVTFLAKFKYFRILDVEESDEYLMDALAEQDLFDKTSSVLNEGSDLLYSDAFEGVKYLSRKIEDLQKDIRIKTYDFVQDTDKRLEEYLKDRNVDKNKIITTNFTELDKHIDGFLPGEELVTLLARINEGKSWILSAFSVGAWLMGKRVGLYNSEMSSVSASYRADTLLSNISNKCLLTGNKAVRDDYLTYINGIQDRNNPLLFATKKELNGKLTISKMEALIKKHELDVFFIDQYSGVEDENAKRGENRKDKYARLSDELMDISIKYGVPIVGAVQANRKSVEGSDEEKMPELDNISDADEIGALSTKVISIRNLKSGLKFKVIKNRYGNKGGECLYYWDIDKGMFKHIPDENSSNKKKKENKDKYQDKTDAF